MNEPQQAEDYPYSSPPAAQHDQAESDDRPRLFRDPAFHGMTVTQLLGAFNDNLFKQLMLLLAIPLAVVAGQGAANQEADKQWLATVVFSLPFILFSGFAGYLSDRYPKRRMIVAAKVAEIVVMSLGLAGFLLFDMIGYGGLLVVLFLMGTQSAFFGPAKYGILPELFRTGDLPRANGVIVMTTFLAIIFGTALAGGLGANLMVQNEEAGVREAGHLWMGSIICVAIAIVGTATSLLIRHTPAATPSLAMTLGSWAIPRDTRNLLWQDMPLVGALLSSCMFWLVSGLAMQAVNSLGIIQLGLNELQTSIMTATIGLGIAAGAVAAGRISHGKADFKLAKRGLWGIATSLLLLSITLPGGAHLLGFWGSLLTLSLLGASAAFFAIPLQVFLQSRPPKEQKGRMIAVMNQTNFMAILISGLMYGAFDRLVNSMAWPRSTIFLFMAIIVLPLAVFFRMEEGESGTANKDSNQTEEME